MHEIRQRTRKKKDERKTKFSVLAQRALAFPNVYGKLCHFTRINYHMIARSIHSLICQLPSAIEYVALTLKPQNPNHNVIVSRKLKKKQINKLKLRRNKNGGDKQIRRKTSFQMR